MTSVQGVGGSSFHQEVPHAGLQNGGGARVVDVAVQQAMEVRQAVNEAMEEMRRAQPANLPRKSIILVGRTGSGKTSVAYGPAGKVLEALYRAGKWSMVAPEPLPGFEIGVQKGSRTTIPHMCRSGDQFGEPVTIVDLPGLDDTRGFSQEVANAVCIQKVFEERSLIKVLVVLDQSEVTDTRATTLIDTMNMIATLFSNNVDQIVRNAALVVTKVYEEHEVRHIVNMIDKSITQCTLTGTAAGTLLAALKERVAIFKEPEQPGPYNTQRMGEDVFACLERAEFAQDRRVNISLSTRWALEADAMWMTIAENVDTQVREVMERVMGAVQECAQQCFNESQGGDTVRRAANTQKLNAILTQLQSLNGVAAGPNQLRTMLAGCTEVMRLCNPGQGVLNIDPVLRRHELISELTPFVDSHLRDCLNVSDTIKSKVARACREVEIRQLQIEERMSAEEANRAREQADAAERDHERQRKAFRDAVIGAVLELACKAVVFTIQAAGVVGNVLGALASLARHR